MTDEELIRRGDALKEIDECGEAWWNAHDAIAALPAVTGTAEAHLAKAVEALRWYAESTHDDAGRRAEAVLAEIGGEG